MKIKLLTLSAGPRGVVQPGTIVEMPDAAAQALIDGGFAVTVGAQTAPAPAPMAAEAAAIEPAEKAVRPRPSPKKRGKREQSN